jgi:hypothetical protein
MKTMPAIKELGKAMRDNVTMFDGFHVYDVTLIGDLAVEVQYFDEDGETQSSTIVGIDRFDDVRQAYMVIVERSSFPIALSLNKPYNPFNQYYG